MALSQPKPAQPIASFEFAREVRFKDTDASGFAHFSSYVQMMEETEYAFLRSRNLSVVLYDDRGTMGFPRLSASIQVETRLRYGHQVNVHLRLMELDGKKLTYDFDIVDEEGVIAVKGQFVAACCRFPEANNPYAILMPEFVVDALQA